jgi:ABC-2 type transport system permease protein
VSALIRVTAAEWVKLRTVRSTWWFAIGALATMILVAVSNADSDHGDLVAKHAPHASVEAASETIVAAGWLLMIFGALGMLVATSEYATRSIMVTLACVPSRGRLMLAKTAVVLLSVFAAGTLIAAIGVACSAPLLHEFADVDAAQLSGQILAIGVQLALTAVLSLGLGVLIRRTAGALTILFVLLFIVPELLGVLAEVLHADFFNTLADYLPNVAGDRFMHGDALWGLVGAGWAATAVLGAVWVLRKRDA